METLAGQSIDSFQRVDFYTSHEALLLHYEQALTRQVPRQWGWFNLSTHFPWIGMRTAALDGAHVEYFRGIRNPIAVKIGPGVTPEQLLRLLDVLDPDNEPGRLTLIHRMGAAKIEDARCRRCSHAVQARRPHAAVVLRSDARQHRNTRQRLQDAPLRRTSATSSTGRSTSTPRPARASAACTSSSPARTSPNAWAARATSPRPTSTRAYKSTVDPRLNYEQSLELAMLIVRKRGGVAAAN